MKFVSRTTLIEKIKETNGNIFSVWYEKTRSDNSIRKINCRLNVVKHLTGTGKAAPASAKVLTVYDMQKMGYRSLAFEGLIEATIGGEVYKIR